MTGWAGKYPGSEVLTARQLNRNVGGSVVSQTADRSQCRQLFWYHGMANKPEWRDQDKLLRERWNTHLGDCNVFVGCTKEKV